MPSSRYALSGAVERLVPKGPAPMEGKGAYVDPATNSARIEIHPHDNLGQDPHAHVYEPQGQRLAADGTVAPSRESKAAHLEKPRSSVDC